jgi:hypothetical protein
MNQKTLEKLISDGNSQYKIAKNLECSQTKVKYWLNKYNLKTIHCIPKPKKCVICGYSKCLASLDFHHRNPKEKDPNWRKMRTWAFEKIKNELDKCELVCKNCHGEIHARMHGSD